MKRGVQLVVPIVREIRVEQPVAREEAQHNGGEADPPCVKRIECVGGKVLMRDLALERSKNNC
jgi:hypothetical protein